MKVGKHWQKDRRITKRGPFWGRSRRRRGALYENCASIRHEVRCEFGSKERNGCPSAKQLKCREGSNPVKSDAVAEDHAGLPVRMEVD